MISKIFVLPATWLRISCSAPGRNSGNVTFQPLIGPQRSR